MLTVQEAFACVMNTAVDFGIEEVSITQAHGRILRETIYADRPFPPFDRVTMDGIALNFQDYENGRTDFEIQGLQAAGFQQQKLQHNGCIEIMTGAILPDNTDTVVPYEDIFRNQNTFSIIKGIQKGQNIHQQGSDVKKGEALLYPGIKITGAEIAVLATVGKTNIRVSRQPKIALVATGDELIAINEEPKLHQLRISNVYAFQSVLNEIGVEAYIHHIKDDKETLHKEFSNLFAQYDLIICSGGVSAGKFDYIPEVLKELNVATRFHKVKQRPGKPLLFAVSDKNVPFFGLPGNPVSGFMCLHRYVLPWLYQSLQMNPVPVQMQAVLTKDVKFDKPLTYFIPVNVQVTSQGSLHANPHLTNGSGDFAILTSANAFMELDEKKDEFKAGEIYPVWFYKSL
ncbi:molybdopterin molybdotransferase MoeA [Solitalea sp. MAHUQ-68]|uniref:Molybdopterin molybdenumtransferase n=1 Tax=Solitalea agri TaxID=2953739 RepID=A0A9X2JD16_9SPHI|nr:molybdopterin molybdotransferase MoeA [Solitalea agri]MCO4292375.1 molybdopterin molybdotransferase MoeA [Solitalea agri]